VEGEAVSSIKEPGLDNLFGEGEDVEVDMRDIEERIESEKHKLDEVLKIPRPGMCFPELDLPYFPTTVGNTKRYSMQLGLYRLSPDAILPTRATKRAACWDVYAAEDFTIGGEGHCINEGEELSNFVAVKTGWRLVIPEGWRIDVKPRSGMAAKQGITVLNAPGTIDHDYAGELMIILGTVSTSVIDFKKGSRIAQIALERVQEFTVKEVSEDELSVIDSDRVGGLGSSGI